MSIHHDDVGRSGRALAEVGAFVERAARAANPARSKLGRVAAAVTVARLGAQLLPAGWRVLRRYPLASTLTIAGILLALYAERPARMARMNGPNVRPLLSRDAARRPAPHL